jgi:hypothetical protein
VGSDRRSAERHALIAAFLLGIDLRVVSDLTVKVFYEGARMAATAGNLVSIANSAESSKCFLAHRAESMRKWSYWRTAFHPTRSRVSWTRASQVR